MTATLVPYIVKKEPHHDFLRELGISIEDKDAQTLLKACTALHTLNQCAEGREWEIGCRAIYEEIVQGVADRHGLYVIFERTKEGPPVKFAAKETDPRKTLKLIGANVWAWPQILIRM